VRQSLTGWRSTISKPFSIPEIRTSVGVFHQSELSGSGIEIRTTDRLTVKVTGHSTDGTARLVASCVRGPSSGIEQQSLRASSDGGDWRSEVTMPIEDDLATLDFRRNDLSKEFCSILTLAVRHRGGEVLRLFVPLRIVNDSIAPLRESERLACLRDARKLTVHDGEFHSNCAQFCAHSNHRRLAHSC